jgi:hypothetical protein
MKPLFLNCKGEVIAFMDSTAYDLARYAMTFKENVYKRSGGGYTIFNHRNAEVKDVTKVEIGKYRIGWLPSKDAGSLYRVCELVTRG